MHGESRGHNGALPGSQQRLVDGRCSGSATQALLPCCGTTPACCHHQYVQSSLTAGCSLESHATICNQQGDLESDIAICHRQGGQHTQHGHTAGCSLESYTTNRHTRQGCLSCHCKRQELLQGHTGKASVHGVLLLPVQSTIMGAFPLNGTYFQTCEVFVDASTAAVPLEVPLSLLGNPLEQEWRAVHFGQSTASICRTMSLDQIAHTFHSSHVSVRSFDRRTGAPQPLPAPLLPAGAPPPKKRKE